MNAPQTEPKPLHPRVYADAITSDPDFLRHKSEAPSNRTALGRTALEYVKRVRERTRVPDIHTQMIDLIGQLDTFREAAQLLDVNEGYRRRDGTEYLTREERKAAVGDTIRFNHTIRHIIEANPHLTTNTIVDFVANAEVILGDAETAEYLKERVRETVFGMQAEIFVEEALRGIDGVEVLEPDDEDKVALDAKGVDVQFTHDGRKYSLDVKATLMQYSHAMKKRGDRKNSRSPIVVWTGLESDEIGGSFRPTDEQLTKIRGHLTKELRLDATPERTLKVVS